MLVIVLVLPFMFSLGNVSLVILVVILASVVMEIAALDVLLAILTLLERA